MESSKTCETILPQVGMLKILLLLNCKKKAFQSEIVWVPCKFFLRNSMELLQSLRVIHCQKYIYFKWEAGNY